jgi:hypothetical protein
LPPGLRSPLTADWGVLGIAFCPSAVPSFEPGATFRSAKSTPRCHRPVRLRRPGSHSKGICRALRVLHEFLMYHYRLQALSAGYLVAVVLLPISTRLLAIDYCADSSTRSVPGCPERCGGHSNTGLNDLRSIGGILGNLGG